MFFRNSSPVNRSLDVSVLSRPASTAAADQLSGRTERRRGAAQIDSGQTSAEYVIDWIVTVLSNK